MRNLYSVFDKKAQAYGPLMEAKHDVIAVRGFGGAIEDERSGFAKYPDDFELHFVGEFDEDSGAEIPVVQHRPRVVITARQWLDAQSPKDVGSQVALFSEAK